jgi:hypothetical protein
MATAVLAPESPTIGQSADVNRISEGRRALLPSPTVPLIYVAGAHACLATALTALVINPGLPGAFVYHPRALALVHLVTLGWVSGSILGALYMVMPLAFGVSMRTRRLDCWACLSFWVGAVAMVFGFWHGRYDFVGIGSPFVFWAFATIGVRVIRGLTDARVPWGVALHVALAFVNVTVAGASGLVLAVNRMTGLLPGSPLSLAAAHAHLAVLGWAMMMIIGVAYRLIPMFVPAAMPSGTGLAASAILLEIGALGVAASLAVGKSALPWVPFVIGALACFVAQVRRIVSNKRPRPVDLPRRDWSTWHTHFALGYLLLAAVLGIAVVVGAPSPPTLWAYGTAGVLGFTVQMVLGIGGRLLPMYAWYRSLERRDGILPTRSVHALIAPRLSLAVLGSWLGGLPVFTAGLMTDGLILIACGAGAMLVGVLLNAAHVALLLHRAGLRHA